MDILVIGCGMVGSALAETLDKQGHDVSVIDRSGTRLETLSPDFGGFTTTGVPIDCDVLKRAGIGTCDALFAVTSDDDTNIMVSELARTMFNVPKIFARIIDIDKGKVFEQLGINIICPTKLTVSAACSALEESRSTGSEINFENHTVIFTQIDLPEHLVDGTIEDIECENEEMLFGLIRKNSGFIMYRGQPLTFAEGDKLIFARKA